MEKKRHFEKYPEVELDETTSKKTRDFWVHPRDLKHGFYIYQIKNQADEHFRISDTRVYAGEDTTGKKFFYVNPQDDIRPIDIINGTFEFEQKCRHSISHITDNDIEVACLKLENLMKPHDIRYLWVFRSWLDNKEDQKECIVHAYTNDNRNNPWIEKPEVLPAHKAATRIIIKLLQDSGSDTKTRFEVETHTIGARMQQHELNRLRRLHHS